MPDDCKKDSPQDCEKDCPQECEKDCSQKCDETCEAKEPPLDCENSKGLAKCEDYKFKPPLCMHSKDNGNKNQPQIKCGGGNVPKQPLLELGHPLRAIGPKQVKILMQFMPSALVYAATSLMLVVYMSDWKAVLQYVPYYNGKYYTEPSAVKTEKIEEPEESED